MTEVTIQEVTVVTLANNFLDACQYFEEVERKVIPFDPLTAEASKQVLREVTDEIGRRGDSTTKESRERMLLEFIEQLLALAKEKPSPTGFEQALTAFSWHCTNGLLA